jgi:hypothetical protein
MDGGASSMGEMRVGPSRKQVHTARGSLWDPTGHTSLTPSTQGLSSAAFSRGGANGVITGDGGPTDSELARRVGYASLALLAPEQPP